MAASVVVFFECLARQRKDGQEKGDKIKVRNCLTETLTVSHGSDREMHV